MHGRVKWVEGGAFLAESGSGHALVVDGPPEVGGRNLGPRPMELLLLAVGSCSAVDVVLILKKARQPVTDVQVELKAERADTDPKVFTAIHLNFIVSGKGLGASHVERAVTLSAEKYCSASIMAGRAGAKVTHGFEIREA
ncbi:MAG TPA: OsmC family protein [Candidatus Binatia bacterium]|nr:OsmC family protein [Candidatus Binatia bacterium]